MGVNPEAPLAAAQTPHVTNVRSNWAGSPARYLPPAKSCVTQVPREEPFHVCQPEMPAILGNLPPPKQKQASKLGGRPKAPPRHAYAFFTQP